MPVRLRAEEVEVEVEYCGLCHSDVSVINNEWGLTQYPLVPGHEIIGKVAALGEQAKGLFLKLVKGLESAGTLSVTCIASNASLVISTFALE